jgi:putative aldouronate transport system substrate-binding protein
MKQGLSTLQQMYKSGTIAQDFGLMDGTKVRSEFATGKCGIIFQPIWGSLTFNVDMLKLNAKAEVVTAPIPGLTENSMSKSYTPSTVNTYLCVSSKYKNPEALVKIFNLGNQKLVHPTSSEEYDMYYGLGGKYTGYKFAIWQGMAPQKNYDNYKKESVAVAKKDPAGLNMEQKQNYDQIVKYLAFTTPDGTNPDYYSGWGLYQVFAAPKCSYSTIDKLVKSNNLTPCLYSAPMSDLMSQKYPILDKLTKETLIKIIYGEPVSSYDKFLTTWKLLGGNAVTEEANEWYSNNGNK